MSNGSPCINCHEIIEHNAFDDLGDVFTCKHCGCTQTLEHEVDYDGEEEYVRFYFGAEG